MNESPDGQLSQVGRARREEMLGELVEVMERTHRARRVRRRALATGGSALVLAIFMYLVLPRVSQNPPVPDFVENTPQRVPAPIGVQAEPQRTTVLTKVITSDPSVLERLRADPPQAVIRMNDRMLLDALASIDRPAGLIRLGDDIRLSAPVTDAELGL